MVLAESVDTLDVVLAVAERVGLCPALLVEVHGVGDLTFNRYSGAYWSSSREHARTSRMVVTTIGIIAVHLRSSQGVNLSFLTLNDNCIIALRFRMEIL